MLSFLDISKVVTNPWNPNVQNERQYGAEIESIVAHGFLAPILVRKVDDSYQIIDGEHRYKALKEIFENNLPTDNLKDLADKKVIPAVVIEVDDARAKKLTIIMNETRGRADLAKLGELLNEIKIDLPEELTLGLPYTDVQLNELMDIAAFDWSALDIPVSDNELEVDDSEAGEFKITAILSPEEGLRWKSLLNEYKNELPKDAKQAAGAMISLLLNKAGK